MRAPIIFAFVLTASLLFVTGCDRSRSDEYPDGSADTTRRVEDIRRNTRDQKDAVDAEFDHMATRHDFDERQIRQKYIAERQQFENSYKEEETERDAEIREIEIKAKHDKEVIDAEIADTLKTRPRQEATEIRADAVARKSEIDRAATNDSAPIRNASERSKADYVQRGIEMDSNESREISTLERERSKARNFRNKRMLEIDRWTNEELAKVGRDSSRHPNRGPANNLGNDFDRDSNRDLSNSNR